MPITRTIMIDDDGTGTTGTVLNNAWLQTIYGQIDTLVGPWTPIPFVPGNFTSDGSGAWTVTSVTTLKYAKIGNVVHVALVTTNASIAGNPATLSITLPPEFVPVSHMANAYNFMAGGVAGVGYAVSLPGVARLDLFRDILGTPWPAGAMYVGAAFTMNV